MQRRITQPSRLLDKKGELKQRGYATSHILNYNRRDVAKKRRLKEWDYYLIQNGQFGLAITVGKANALALISVTFFDFDAKKYTSGTAIALVPFGRIKMPESSVFGDILFKNHRVSLSIRHVRASREIFLKMKRFHGFSDLEASILLTNEPWDSMVIATPFKEDPKAFYYNRKIIGMKASGRVRIKEKTYHFSKSDSFGLLDWGRGVWPHKVTWYWGAGQGIYRGSTFGFNLGYGFGDTSAATENMLFYRGIGHKLRGVTFNIPKNDRGKYDYLKPWTITSSDHRFEMEFAPILDRSVSLSALVVSTNQHQVFGRYTGTAILDDGTIIRLSSFPGFAGRVRNRW